MMTFSKDLANNKLNVTRTFNAPVEKVWKAWTDSAVLDQWWAPKPWRTETKTMDFNPGGHWLYAMVGPEGEKHWSICTFEAINARNSFKHTCKFCDEHGQPTAGFPAMHWLVEMSVNNGVTTVNVTLSFDNTAGLEQLVAMGFEGGFNMGLNQLEELLAA